MATKNHALDGRIITAAKEEFLASGYEKASLRKIAANAGVTVGAIYTRYSTKDSLFRSLVQPLIDRIEAAFSSIRAEYYGGIPAAVHPAGMAAAMQMEAEAILHLLFDHYDQAVLLLCRSAGSSLANFFDGIVQRKMEETVLFFQAAGGAVQPDARLLKLLLTVQFHSYYQIIEEGYALSDAKVMMNAMMTYHTGGWMALLGLSAPQIKPEV